MCENMGKEPINHSKNTKLKTRQDVATKAIPSIVQALATIISDSKSDHFKQKCCKMFEVDNTSSIDVHLEARLWEIARTRLGVTSPNNTKTLHQSNANVRTESEKDDFEDLMFFSHPDATNFYEEETVKSQVYHNKTKNAFSRTSESMPAFNTENMQNSMKQDFDKSQNQPKVFHIISDISCNPTDSDHVVSWNMHKDNHRHQASGEVSHADNEDYRMSGLNKLDTCSLHVSSVQENELASTQGCEQLTNNMPNAMEINPSLHQTTQPKKLKSPVCLQKTLPAPKGHSDSHDDDWLNNYEQDDFWMDHSCPEAQIRGSNKLTQRPNKVPVCVGNTTTNMKIRKDAAGSYHANLKENGELETYYMMENCCSIDTTFHYNICKLASSQSSNQEMEAECTDLQTLSDTDQLKVYNDDNFEALADFS